MGYFGGGQFAITVLIKHAEVKASGRCALRRNCGVPNPALSCCYFAITVLVEAAKRLRRAINLVGRQSPIAIAVNAPEERICGVQGSSEGGQHQHRTVFFGMTTERRRIVRRPMICL